MSMLAKLGIAQRLYAVVALISLALAGLTVFTYAEMQTVISDADRIAEQRMPQMQRVSSMEIDVTRASLQLRHAMLSRTPEEQAATLEAIGTLRQRIDAQLAEYDKGATTDEARKRFAPLPGLMAGFWKAGEANIALIQQGDMQAAFAFLVDKTIPERNLLLAQLAEGTAFYKDALLTDVQEIEDQAKAALNK